MTITSCAPVRALSRPTRPPQSAPASHAGQDRQGHVDRPGHLELVADPAGGRAGDQHLAAAADVEQRGPEGQADTEPGDDQRSGELQGLGQGPDRGLEVVDAGVVDRAAEQRGVGAPDGVPGRREEVSGPGEDVAEVSRTSSSVNMMSSEPTVTASSTEKKATAALPGGDLAQGLCASGRRSGPPASRSPALRGRRRGAGAGLVGGVLMRRLLPDARRSSSGRARRAGCRAARSRRSGRGRAP